MPQQGFFLISKVEETIFQFDPPSIFGRDLPIVTDSIEVMGIANKYIIHPVKEITIEPGKNRRFDC
jgi:hypothetical protein